MRITLKCNISFTIDLSNYSLVEGEQDSCESSEQLDGQAKSDPWGRRDSSSLPGQTITQAWDRLSQAKRAPPVAVGAPRTSESVLA